MFEPAEQSVGAQHLHPRRGELERERQRIQPAADGHDGGAVGRSQLKVGLHVPYALDEQPHGWRARQIGG
jgi:hypothetical protein